jgi:DNA methylase
MHGKKLELIWTNKDKSLYFDVLVGKYEWVDKKDPRVSEPRILIEKKTFGDSHTENILVKGDNLLALKALMPDFRNRVKLVFIDPPYNTGNAFEHYDDGLEHSIWLTLMRDRLLLLRQLLKTDGSIWISIDDDESHYLKVLCDEIFGRENFVANVIWQKKYSPQNDAKWLSDSHDHILHQRGQDKAEPLRLVLRVWTHAVEDFADTFIDPAHALVLCYLSPIALMAKPGNFQRIALNKSEYPLIQLSLSHTPPFWSEYVSGQILTGLQEFARQGAVDPRGIFRDPAKNT